MPYQVNVFNSWQSYSSWTELKQWLTSKDGGLLHVVEPPNSSYALVKYTKGVSNFDVPHVRWCRSLIVDKTTRLPVSVAPPKSCVLTDTSVNDATVAEEFVDGTMMNVFQFGTDSPVHVATRSRLGADRSYYKNSPSFRAMLEDAMNQQCVQSLSDMLPVADSVSRFTSVIVQHPANLIVRCVEVPSFVIVHQGWVDVNGNVFVEEDASNFHCVSSKEDDGTEIQPYNLESIRAAKSVKEWVSVQSRDRQIGWQGVVLKDGTGNRWRERCDVYETVRKLRGNETTAEERYARLRKMRTVDQYLAFYPNDKDAFYGLEGLLRKNTRTLFHFYVDTFRKRQVLFHELPWPYKHHVSVLHNYYKDVLRADKKILDLEAVIRYVNGLSLEDGANMLKEHRIELVKKDTSKAPVDVAVAPVAEVSA